MHAYTPEKGEMCFCLILSMYCADAIKVLEDGDLQTIGLLDYDKRLSHAFTAHPKVDPFTGKIYFHVSAAVEVVHYDT